MIKPQASMADSIDPERWQDSVDVAEILLLLSKGQALGLCHGLLINRRQCLFVLTRGQELGFIPEALERRFARLQGR
jgi:hypothetical protein